MKDRHQGQHRHRAGQPEPRGLHRVLIGELAGLLPDDLRFARRSGREERDLERLGVRECRSDRSSAALGHQDVAPRIGDAGRREHGAPRIAGAEDRRLRRQRGIDEQWRTAARPQPECRGTTKPAEWLRTATSGQPRAAPRAARRPRSRATGRPSTNRTLAKKDVRGRAGEGGRQTSSAQSPPLIAGRPFRHRRAPMSASSGRSAVRTGDIFRTAAQERARARRQSRLVAKARRVRQRDQLGGERARRAGRRSRWRGPPPAGPC